MSIDMHFSELSEFLIVVQTGSRSHNCASASRAGSHLLGQHLGVVLLLGQQQSLEILHLF